MTQGQERPAAAPRPTPPSRERLWLRGLALCLVGATAGCAQQRAAALSVSGGPEAAYGVLAPILTEWTDAVNDGDVDAAVALYAPDARIRLNYLAQYPELPQAVEEWMDGVQSLLFGPADFDSSARLVYGVVRVVIVPNDGGPRRRGVMTVIATPFEGEWRIRGQYLAVQ